MQHKHKIYCLQFSFIFPFYIPFIFYSTLSSFSCIISHFYSLIFIFAHKISMGEDIDFWVRIAAYAPIVYSNKCLMYYRKDSEENLSSKGLKSLSLSFPYWRWYDLKSFSPYKDKFTTRMIYFLAMMGRCTGESLMIRQVLSKIVGSYLIFSRICLYICSFNMSFFLVIDTIKRIKRHCLSN